ncbi:MAG: hypothetical protein IIB19_00345 [Chloroflexi bacterium]|nr:hypothetical protein [Chloroflexota bacterium]
MANFDAPWDFVADSQGRARLQMVNKVAAYDRELALNSTITGSEKEARLTLLRGALQDRVDQSVAFLNHYFTL